MNEDHEQDKPEPVDDVIEITNQQTAAVPTTHTSGGRLLSYVTQLATTRKDHVTFWSLPREVRDMIWSEVLGPEDDVFQANMIRSVSHRKSKARAPAPASGYETLRTARRDDGRFTYAHLLLSSRPPLPLAHLCQESRAFALQKYDAAYSKARGPDLNQEKGGRFRWLSRHAARIASIKIDDLTYEDLETEVPLGENERLILDCHRSEWCPWGPTANPEANQHSLRRTALLELLKKAKDHQIMICSHIEYRMRYFVDRNIVRKWGVFANRAPGEDFAKDRATKRNTRIFVEVRDVFPMVQLLRDINMRGRTVGMRHLREENLFPDGTSLGTLKGRKFLQEVFSECSKPFEELWAENVNENETASQSRYGRMPKMGLVFEYNFDFEHVA